MKRRLMIIFGVIGFVMIISILSIVFYKKNIYRDDYITSKEKTVKFFLEHKEDIEKIAEQNFIKKSFEKKTYKGIESINYSELKDNRGYVTLEVGSQGFLGGQYWGLIYSPYNDFIDGKDIDIYDEYKESSKGNNIFIIEKIENNWYFYYDDYDGKVDISVFN